MSKYCFSIFIYLKYYFTDHKCGQSFQNYSYVFVALYLEVNNLFLFFSFLSLTKRKTSVLQEEFRCRLYGDRLGWN